MKYYTKMQSPLTSNILLLTFIIHADDKSGTFMYVGRQVDNDFYIFFLP